jgi:hypothetical protein
MIPTLNNLEILQIRSIELITLGVKCAECGHTWGVRLNGKTDLATIPMKFLICENCLKKANQPKEGEIVSRAE